jgi:hypothetical protein
MIAQRKETDLLSGIDQFSGDVVDPFFIVGQADCWDDPVRVYCLGCHCGGLRVVMSMYVGWVQYVYYEYQSTTANSIKLVHMT